MTTRYLSWDTHENEEITKKYIQSKLSMYNKEFFLIGL